MQLVILFPNQLFELKYIPRELLKHNFFLIEHDNFYGFDGMIFNKKKIMLHKASCLAYVETMKRDIKINYVAKYPKLTKNDSVAFFDPIDKVLVEEIEDTYKHVANLDIYDNPNFMTTHENLDKFYEAHSKNTKFIHATFYKFQLELHDIPYIKKSYDKENRNAIPHKMTNLPTIEALKYGTDEKYIKVAKQFVEKYFKNNYGTCDDFYIPITHEGAKKLFDRFLKTKMKNFSDYQDAIVPKNPLLFHSFISAVMNIGLIQPSYVIEKIIHLYEEKRISLKNYEAFVRQVIGWREYQRFIYEYLEDRIVGKNYFNNTKKLSTKWYDGTLGIPPVDDTIQMAFKYGYIHHILRLMVMCNFMNLYGIHPAEVYRWFMEFSIDSYSWVMVGNVYSMGMWADGGLTMKKPYISSYNYIDQMSNKRYDDSGDWRNKWKQLYYSFLLRNQQKLKHTIHARNVYHAKRLS